MKKFNKDKYLRRLKLKRMLSNNSRKIYIILLCLSCFIIGIYFAHSKFFVSEDQEIIRTTVGNFTQGDVVIGTYLDGKYSSTIPSKNDGYTANEVVCDNEATGSWDNEAWQLTVKNLKVKTKCNIYFTESFIYNYEYSGNEDVMIVKKAGKYKLEVWGAQGGDASAVGGFGGYSVGEVNLNENDQLYINVGEQGTSSLIFTSSFVVGGHFAYNGGGQSSSSKDSRWGGGGGATHIAKVSGLLSKLENNKDDILIVAGGGGGAGNWNSTQNNGGAGGGYIGKNGSGGDIGYGATQSAPGANTKNGESLNRIVGAFGQGGSVGAGGGGGYYGGGSGWVNGSSAGGGSGYIGNSLLSSKVMYCYNCGQSSKENTKTVSTTCNEETPTENCAKKGNGYAKITYIEEN